MSPSDFPAAVQALQRALGGPLPADYLAFLQTHAEPMLDPPWACTPSAAGDSEPLVIDGLYTLAQLALHLQQQACLDETTQRLLIGYDLMGGYLYLGRRAHEAGAVFYREPYRSADYLRLADSFGAWQAGTWPQVQDD